MKKNILLVIASILLTLTFFELALRIYKWPRKSGPDLEQHVCQYDSLLGWKGISNISLSSRKFNGDRLIIQHNSTGYRDNEYGYEKPAGKKRILILGDSFSWGFNVNLEDTFHYLLEKKLADYYQVISLGIPGYSTDQEYLLLKSEGLKYDPDIVMLFYFVDDSYANGAIAVHNGKYPKPYFITDESNNLILKNNPVINYESDLRIVSFIKKYAYKFRAGYHKPGDERGAWSTLNFTEKYSKSQDWRITYRLLEEINKLCLDNDITFIISIIPIKPQLDYENLNLPQKLLTKFGERNNIRVIDLLPDLTANKQSDPYFKKDLHWNETGHLLVADIIYQYLCTHSIHSQ